MSARRIQGSVCTLILAVTCSVRAQNRNDISCNPCHEQGQKLQNSAHAPVECATCHPRHEKYPHPSGVGKPSCTRCHEKVAGEHARSVHGLALKQGNAAAPDCTVCHGNVHELPRATSPAFRKAVPDTCGLCHAQIAEEFRGSVHGRAVSRGIADAPVCTTCHGEHLILPPTSAASPVHPSHIRETCGQCHGSVRLSRRFGFPPDRVVSFDASFHGMAAKAGSQTVANCASCHGVHNILPSADPRSTIHPRNLPTTCGHCHRGAGTRFALGLVHQVPGGAEPGPVRWARALYLTLIPLTIGWMFLHNLGDWLRKLARIRFSKNGPGAGPYARLTPPPEGWGSGEIRMYAFERLQHALLLLSFIVLAWTGFALKYPEGWWARPLLVWESQWPVRGTVHRVAAAIFILVGALHGISLLRSEQLRRHWKLLWPRRGDMKEALLNFAYNMGLRTERPRVRAHSYVEKVEYWAVVWGGVIMGLTGVMLWANNFVLAWLPKSILDFATAVHFYEAVLAVLAIAVWHFYWVIFDPEVYPMDPAWLSGRSARRREREEDDQPTVTGSSNEKGTSNGPSVG